jgi:hypothetical protein
MRTAASWNSNEDVTQAVNLWLLPIVGRVLIDRVDAATAAFQVGCESPSQFSREYSGGTRPSGGRGVEKRNGRKVPRVHGQRALRQGVIFRCFLPATQALEN